jgi:hypothetical protein
VEAVARAICAEHVTHDIKDDRTLEQRIDEEWEDWRLSAEAAIAALSPDLKADNAALVGRMAAALELGHETLHQCTAVLSANDCATVAKAMLEMRQALAAFKKSALTPASREE